MPLCLSREHLTNKKLLTKPGPVPGPAQCPAWAPPQGGQIYAKWSDEDAPRRAVPCRREGTGAPPMCGKLHVSGPGLRGTAVYLRQQLSRPLRAQFGSLFKGSTLKATTNRSGGRLVSTGNDENRSQYYLLNAVLGSHMNSRVGPTREKKKEQKKNALTNQKIFNLDQIAYKKRDNLLDCISPKCNAIRTSTGSVLDAYRAV